jgi:nucleotide-binding universal stress UspA family protein/predicted transcriptional regulator
MKNDEGEGTNERMKIVIGYDGSEHAGAALDDLRQAGLPRDAEALIVSVAEGEMPLLSVSGIAENGLDPERIASAVTYASNAIAQAKEFARLGGERIKSSFPEWGVSAEYLVGDPADALMERATNWGTDLIVVGSQGRSAIGRLILGSVSRKIVTEARCSVRVARATAKKDDRSARIVIGMDGSSFANAAVDAVTARRWPAGVEARIVTVTKPFHMYGEAPAMQKSRARVIQDAAMAEISEAELAVSSQVIEGDPKRALIEKADAWGANCIFIGSRGLNGALHRFFLGSVSTGVVTNASCSVEVVRLAERSAERPTEEEEGVGEIEVVDVMTKDVIAVRADTPLQEIARLLKERRIGGVPVIDGEGEVIGIVSDCDLFLKQKKVRRLGIHAPAIFGQFIEPEDIAEIYERARRLTAADVMTKAAVTVEPQDQVGQVAERMMRDNLRRVPVTRDGKLVGIISRSDIIHLLAPS